MRTDQMQTDETIDVDSTTELTVEPVERDLYDWLELFVKACGVLALFAIARSLGA
jgi:hypothetical protein